MQNHLSSYRCPVCSRSYSFTHSDITLGVCVCGTVLNRLEGDVVVTKPFAVLTEEPELIQPGTTGRYDGKRFRVLGRIRAWFQAAVFNYWTILLDEQELAWLAEGYGMYAVYRRADPFNSLGVNNLSSLEPGLDTIVVRQETFLLQRSSSTCSWEIQGEMYLPAPVPSFSVYEFSAGSGKQMTLVELMPGYTICFTVLPVPFGSLQFASLNPHPFMGKEIVCAVCSHHFTVRTYPFAQTYTCSSCDTCYSYEGGSWKGITKQRGPNEIKPGIRLHSTGNINGISYSVIGYTLKKERKDEQSAWREYTLFNAAEGFAFLSEFEGHWMVAREKQDGPVFKKGHVSTFTYDHEPFTLFNRYTYEAFNIKGEFPYNIILARDTMAEEYISPPEMWIREISPREGIGWFKGEHVDATGIAKNFDLPGGLPPQSGIGVVEPTGYISPPKIAVVTVVGVIGFVVCFLLAALSHSNKVVLDQTYAFQYGTESTVSVVTPPFYLGKWKSNLEITVSAPVQNSWFELGATLVNSQTGTEYSMEKGVEYYSGYSDGESWSEGSTTETAYLGEIPEGRYYLQLQGTRDMNSSGSAREFQVQVVYDVPAYRNLVIGMLLILLWPAFQFSRNYFNEKQRWYNSPYSSYTYED